MIAEDQGEVLEFLASGTAFGLSRDQVERIDTHCAVVFLAGDRAYKLRRAVRYDYLDYSTLERRREMSLAELELNRRTAPAIYHDVVAVRRQADGTLVLNQTGEPVEWLLEMARFDGDLLFDRLAERGALDMAWMPALAERIAKFHAGAERRLDHGGAAGMAWVIDGNEVGFAEHGLGVLDAAACARLTARSRAALERWRAQLDVRQRTGLVRRCHGDLHLRNIVLLEGTPTLFDAVEFNDRISCVDVLYDVAFLLMDLLHRGLQLHANALFSRYLLLTDDLEGLAPLPLFLSCRAAVRAKVAATAFSVQEEASQAAEQRSAARRYLAMAEELLSPPPARLVALGGVSGSGKSTLAAALAPAIGAAPGALLLRSDEVRKRLLGVDPRARLPPSAYTADVTRRVYALLREWAVRAARAGHAAVVDATFLDAEERSAVARAAVAEGVPFRGFWLEAPADVLQSRVHSRAGDASDADVGVLRRQLARDAGAIAWTRLDAARPAAAVLAQAEESLCLNAGPG